MDRRRAGKLRRVDKPAMDTPRRAWLNRLDRAIRRALRHRRLDKSVLALDKVRVHPDKPR